MESIIDDSTLLEQLKKEDNASFELLYKLYFPSINSYIKQNMGNSDDAADIFQEAIIVLLQKVRQPDFVLTSSLKTYLYAIAKNIWLKRLRNNKIMSLEEFEEYQTEPENFSNEITPEKTKDEKVTSWLTRITDNCQQILKAIFYYRIPMESLMEKMGWKNKHTASTQQYKCIQQVKREKEKEDNKKN
jgi:RNA polymerase sigma factor (sigma-70 family)